jgi:hypothetical protein
MLQIPPTEQHPTPWRTDGQRVNDANGAPIVLAIDSATAERIATSVNRYAAAYPTYQPAKEKS